MADLGEIFDGSTVMETYSRPIFANLAARFDDTPLSSHAAMLDGLRPERDS